MKDILITQTCSKELSNLSNRIIISNMPKQVSTVKPYCKVCHDAGKSEKEYTSHYVKSAPGPEGKVVCPTLLAQCCGYCGACGHTPKFCPTLAAQKAAEEKALKQAARKEVMEKREAAPKPAAKKLTTSNIFAALDSDSDDEPKKVSRPQFIEPKPVSQPLEKVEPNSRGQKPAAAAKLFANVNEFPSLSGATSSAATKAAPKAVATKGKPQFLSAINQLCPQLNVAAKMPEVNIAKPQMAQLVRKQAAAEAQAEEEYEEPEPSDFTMADYFEAAFQRPPMKASEMNWAATEDSDDEDW
jgi:hypothetical protein